MLASLVVYMEDQGNWKLKTEREFKVIADHEEQSDGSFKSWIKAIMFHVCRPWQESDNKLHVRWYDGLQP